MGMGMEKEGEMQRVDTWSVSEASFWVGLFVWQQRRNGNDCCNEYESKTKTKSTVEEQ
jgi:hypothetical protein